MKGATSVIVLKTRVTVIAGGISWGCTNGQRNSGEKTIWTYNRSDKGEEGEAKEGVEGVEDHGE
jgi:hypothetical protein